VSRAGFVEREPGLEQTTHMLLVRVKDGDAPDRARELGRGYPPDRPPPTTSTLASIIGVRLEEMARQIALLRGVNLGGQKRVQMARLRELVQQLDYRDVTTYVQSGNVVFTGPDEPSEAVAEKLEAQIAASLGFEVPVVVRSREELAEVVRANPMRDIATVPARYHVIFLKDAVRPERLTHIEPAEFDPDRFHMHGREVYLWTPEGLGTSRLARALTDKRLGQIATARNWKTVERLLAIADE